MAPLTHASQCVAVAKEAIDAASEPGADRAQLLRTASEHLTEAHTSAATEIRGVQAEIHNLRQKGYSS